MSGLQITLIVALALPALAIVLWPLVGGRSGDSGAAAEHPRDDRRLELEEEKVALYRALRALAGMGVTVFGLASGSTLEVTVLGNKIKTNDAGLALAALGFLMSCGTAKSLPKGVQLFAEITPTGAEKLVRWVSVLSLIALVTTVALLIVSLVLR